MRLLLDTHIFIWFVEGNTAISQNARQLIQSPENEKYISLVSFYEMAIKIKIGKLALAVSIETYLQNLQERDVQLLPIKENHIITYELVPLIDTHRDPFDRLIIAIALFENIAILTADRQFENYTSLVKVIH